MLILSTRAFSDVALAELRAVAPTAEIATCETRDLADFGADALAQAEVLFTTGPVPTREQSPRLRWVQGNFAGVDQVIDAPIVRASGLTLTTAAGVHAVTMGEYALMAMLAHAHRLLGFVDMKRAGAWRRDDGVKARAELHGATLGLIGYGAIGRETARLARAFGMRVLALRASVDAPGAEDGNEILPPNQLDDLLRASDYVVLLAPLTERTRGMIGRRELETIKPGAYLINLARGALVDETAMIDALRSGQLAGAALDVFETEPLPANSPLWTLDNVILSPHIAGLTPRYEARVIALFADNLRRYLAGQPLRNVVDPARGY
jgi:phosphoglycerate dehydrogenase-like enzyme